jgi:hypothetical protein
MAKRRQPLTQERAQGVVDSYKIIKALAKMIEYEHYNYCDTDFKDPIIHQHVGRILESVHAINNATARVLSTSKGTEEQGGEYVNELLRSIKFNVETMSPDVLKAYNDGLENMDKERFKTVEVTA